MYIKIKELKTAPKNVIRNVLQDLLNNLYFKGIMITAGNIEIPVKIKDIDEDLEYANIIYKEKLICISCNQLKIDYNPQNYE